MGRKRNEEENKQWKVNGEEWRMERDLRPKLTWKQKVKMTNIYFYLKRSFFLFTRRQRSMDFVKFYKIIHDMPAKELFFALWNSYWHDDDWQIRPKPFINIEFCHCVEYTHAFWPRPRSICACMREKVEVRQGNRRKKVTSQLVIPTEELIDLEFIESKCILKK